MIKKSFTKWTNWVEQYRFKLLILATILVLVLPAFSGNGLLGNILFITSMSFLFIQSMIVATNRSSKGTTIRSVIVVVMIILFSLDPLGLKSASIELLSLFLLAIFFGFIAFYLIRFLRNAPTVNVDVIITAINIYLLFGIISASLSFLCFRIYSNAYLFPSNIIEPNFVTFLYYSFITMATVGYGDITPRIPETQTLAYLFAVTGQLYVAIIIAFLVGKLLMHPEKA